MKLVFKKRISTQLSFDFSSILNENILATTNNSTDVVLSGFSSIEIKNQFLSFVEKEVISAIKKSISIELAEKLELKKLSQNFDNFLLFNYYFDEINYFSISFQILLEKKLIVNLYKIDEEKETEN
jgi:hypothetical protein